MRITNSTTNIISKDRSPEHSKIFLGCAVWDQGQLNNEILENSWIITNSDKNLIFHNRLYIDV